MTKEEKTKKTEKTKKEKNKEVKTEKISKKTKVKNKKVGLKNKGKKYNEVLNLIDKQKVYSPEEAIKLAIKTSPVKFDASLEIHAKLGIKPEHSDQNVRTVADLPEGTGKKIKIAAIISPEKEKAVKDAGADYTGADDLVSKIAKGFLDFDIVIATPDMMGKIGKIGKILGTKGLMPNPKTGTVADSPEKAVKQFKKGRVELRNDKAGIVHASFGKISMGEEKLQNNLQSLLETLIKAKPQTSKGQFMKGIHLTTTMGPSVKVDVNKISELIKKH